MQMSEWSKSIESVYQDKLPLGHWFEVAVNWLQMQFSSFFNALSGINEGAQSSLQTGLGRIDPLIWLVVLTVLIIIFSRSILCTVLSILAMLLILNLGLWSEFMESLVVWAMAFFMGGVIGLAIGFILSRWQSLRCVAYRVTLYKNKISMLVFLVPAIALFQQGPVAQFFAAIIIAALFWTMVMLQSISDVPRSLLAMGTSLGGSKAQQFYKIELPYTFASIRGRLGKVALGTWLMVILSGLIGPLGLGSALVKALLAKDNAAGFEVALIVALSCIGMFRIFQGGWIKSGSKEVLA